MSAYKDLSYKSRVFTAGELAGCLAKLANETGGEGARLEITVFKDLADGTSHQRTVKIEEIATVCDLRTDARSLLVSLYRKESMGRHGHIIFRSYENGFFDLEFSSDDPVSLSTLISKTEEILLLTGAPSREERERLAGQPPVKEQLATLSQRVTALEQAAAAGASRPVAFLSFRFHEKSTRYATAVRQYLELLDVKVITGEGYEPRPTSEKVRQKLSAGIDMVVMIQTAEESSGWIRDEIAAAQQPNVFLIPLIERGTKFDAGIYADHEYIEFAPDHIGDSFLKLLEAVIFVRRNRRSRTAESYAAATS
jgi:hypothetical protein